MTPPDYSALRKLAEAASPLPWSADRHAWSPWVTSADWVPGGAAGFVFKCGSRSDAEYVVAACNSLPALLDRVALLESALESTPCLCPVWHGDAGRFIPCRTYPGRPPAGWCNSCEIVKSALSTKEGGGDGA